MFASSHHSDGDDLLFASSELNTTGHHHQTGTTVVLHSKTPVLLSGRRTAGIEPRVPMVTVNPHQTATLEGSIGKIEADVTSGSNSVHNIRSMQAKERTLGLNFDEIDQSIRLR
jgi:hypothetical protein